MPSSFIAISAAVLGALVGSFLNVLIHRLPRGGDVVFARSACPSCGGRIPFYLNVPLLSYAWLRGKCRGCGAAIRIRYPLVEALAALLFVVALPGELSSTTLYGYVLTVAVGAALIVHFFIDLEHRLLLDKVNLYLLFLLLPYGVIFHTPAHWLGGALLGFGGPFFVSWAFYKLRGKIGLGGGDIKLWGVLGLFLGPAGVMENIFLSCLLGSVVGMYLIWRGRYNGEDGIPFGPFIIGVAFAQILFPLQMDVISVFRWT